MSVGEGMAGCEMEMRWDIKEKKKADGQVRQQNLANLTQAAIIALRHPH